MVQRYDCLRSTLSRTRSVAVGIALVLLGLVATGLPAPALAQGVVEGTVIDGKTGTPIPGAQVVVVGTSRGAATDAEGAYRIPDVPAGEQTIQAQFVGYGSEKQTVTVPDGETITLDFTLRESAINLDEVVVTGTGGPVEKKKLGNSIASVDASDLENAPVQNVSELLQGREPSVVGLPSSGTTGEGARIRIRGSASLSQSNEPIVYVDGVRVDNGGGFSGATGAGGGGTPSRLDDINPDAIQRVEILKGAAAATLYGSEASNGVIQIFTKKGQAGDAKFTFKTRQSLSAYPDRNKPNVGFASTDATAQQMSQNLSGSYEPYELVSRTYINDLYETGRSQTYSLSAEGGSESVTYFINGRFQRTDGPFGGKTDRGYPQDFSTQARDINRLGQFNANLNILPSENLQITATTAYTDRHVEVPQNNNNTSGPLALASFGRPQLVGPNNREGIPVFATVNETLQITTEQDVSHFFSSAAVSYQPLESLSLDATVGLDFANQKDTQQWPYDYNMDSKASTDTLGARYLGNRSNTELTYDVKGTHDVGLGDRFSSKLVVGSQGFLSQNSVDEESGTIFAGPDLEVVSATAQRNAEEAFSEVVSLGFFAQEQVGYNDWVFVTVGGRLDANSAFGSDFDAVFYPKIQTSIPLTDAPFWQEIGPVSSLRLRAAIGQSGLQPGAFDALRTFVPLASEQGPGVAPGNLGNPSLKPEVATEWETGLEAGLFGDRVAVSATYWNRTVNDALVQRQTPPTMGFQPSLFNVGETNAQGVEVSIDGTVYQSDRTSVELFANTAYLWEEVTDLGGAPPIKVGGNYPRERNFIKEGYSPGSFFGAKLQDTPSGRFPFDTNGDGQADTREQLLSYFRSLDSSTASLNELNGFVLLADEDGDGDQLDHFLGKPTPDWQGSFGGTVQVGNFSMQTLFEYKAGNYHVNNLTQAFREANAGIGRNTPETARLERDYITGGVNENLTPQNDAEVRFNAAQRWINDYLALAPFSGMNMIQSADFLRWRELSLTYTLPSYLLENWGPLRSASFTVAGRNLMLFTGYEGIDPEANAIGRGGGSSLDNNFLLGTEVFALPLQRQFSATLQIGF